MHYVLDDICALIHRPEMFMSKDIPIEQQDYVG